MISLNTYPAFKAWLRSILRRDARLQSIVFGEDQRMLDEQRSKINYPYAWVHRIEDVLMASGDHNMRDGWQFNLLIGKGAPEDDIDKQEDALELCHDILRSILLYFRSEKVDGRIFFNLNMQSMTMIQGDYPDGVWGWLANIEVATPSDTLCADEQESLALQLIDGGFFGDIQLTINANVFSYSWDSIEQTSDQAIAVLLLAINSASIGVRAEQDIDGYLLLSGAGMVVNADPVPGSPHTWSKPFENEL